MMPLLIRLVPQMRNRIRQCVAAQRTDESGRSIQRWHAEWQPECAARNAELRNVTPSALTVTALDEYLAQTVALLEKGCEVHFLLGGAVSFILADFVFTCRDVLGWDEQRTFEMLNGLSEKSTEPARQLAELARTARERPAVLRLLERVDARTADAIAEADPGFAAAISAYQHVYGCRCLRYELADPTLAEMPTLVLQLIRGQLVRRFDPTTVTNAQAEHRAAAVVAARAALAARPPAERQRFERVLARAEQAYPVREDNEFFTLSVPLALVRSAVHEVGRRLAERRLLAQGDDVFFLELAEARAALDNGDTPSNGAGNHLRTLVARRKAERLWVEAHPGAASYGKEPGPPPSFRAFPPEARLMMEALLWGVDRIFAAEQSQRSQATSQEIRGAPASAGRYTGPARVVMSEAEFGKLQPGDVLVCPITSPVWSVLFPSVGALVTDTGGILSHPAIIAREYRVPAVVATGNATQVLRDGQLVEVDGTAGTVQAVHRP
jgi:rifampicin phosphotransferase